MYGFCKYRLDPENHLLESEGSPIPLTPKAFEILVVLVQNGSRLSTKEELMRRVWPDSFVEEANLTVNISALRKQLGETPSGSPYIETVPKKGYRFVAPVSQISTNHCVLARSAEDSEKQSLDEVSLPPVNDLVKETAQKKPWPAKNWVPVSVIGLCLLIILLAAVRHRATQDLSGSKQIALVHRSLAVLPFQNLGRNADSSFLGFSLADAVITKLGYVSELRVRPSYSVQKYASQTIDIPRIAAELNVDTLLTGTFLHEGDNLRISCQLIDVKTDDILWKGAFDLKYDKVLTVQDEVAHHVIQGLEVTLSAPEEGRLKTIEPVSPMAYEYFLRGVDLYAKGDYPTALKMLEKSTELAPQFALAWANLGKSYNANASFQFEGSKNYDKAQAAISKALALEPDEIDARIYMANMFTDTGKVEQAVPLLREVLKTNPNNAEIHWELGYAYRFAGMLSESASESELARRLDPGVKLNSSTPNAYLYKGQYNLFLKSLPSDDTALIVFYRGLGEYYKKDLDQAAADFDRAYELDRSLLQAGTGKAISFAIKHQFRKGLKILGSLEAKINQRGMVDPEATYKVAQAYAIVGDRNAAIRVLRKSIGNGFFPYPYFATDTLLDSLREDKEFSRLMEAARARHERFRNRTF